ncbi:hypothetical protein [Catellatospora sp. NPDC049609]|uniref:hypothetical protein n=1 Tax=Catellatospora sp. NPDC049609 TaxID=3155505 RepID=UPI00342FF660
MGTTRRWLARTALAGAVGALLVTGPAGVAQADDRLLDTDRVKVNAVGFDLGTGSYDNIQFSSGAPVEWLVDDNDVTPHLTGILQLSGVHDECARVRIDYYSSGTVFLTTRNGGTVCADDNGYHPFSVDLDPYTSNKIGKVKVSIEVLMPDGTYDITGSAWSTLSPFVDDDVLVADSVGSGVWGIGFGGTGWSGGSPLSGGTVDWDFSGGQIEPHLTGVLHMESAAGDCVRMRIDYYGDDGADADAAYDLLHVDHGGTVCAVDNAHHEWTVDRHAFSDDNIRHIRVAIEEQTGPGAYQVIDSTYSYFGT